MDGEGSSTRVIFLVLSGRRLGAGRGRRGVVVRRAGG